MKTMMILDFLTLKERLVHTLVLFGIMVVAVAVLTGGSPFLILYVVPIVMITVLKVFMQEASDSGWEGFRLALPLTRSQVVAGRYAIIALIIAGGAVAGALVCLAISALFCAAPTLQQLISLPVRFDPVLFMLAFSGAIAGMLVLMGLMLPLVMRFGFVGGLRYAPLVMLVMVLLAFTAMGPSGMSIIQKGMLASPSSLGTTLALSATLLAVSVLWYVASARLAARFYQKRDL